MERIAALFALLVLVFATGCTAPAEEKTAVPACNGVFALPEGLTDAENAGFLDAAAQWNEYVGYQLVKFDTAGCTVQFGETQNPDWWGQFNHTTQVMTLDRVKLQSLPAENVSFALANIAVHEMGHSLGFHHSEHGRMANSTEPEWNAEDRQQCLDLGYCN